MRAGELKTWVTIERRTGDVDAEGNPATDWRPLATVPAAGGPLNARQVLVGMAQQTRVTHQWTIRYMAGVDQNARVRLGERIQEIASVLDTDEAHRELVLLCVELEE